MDYVTAEPDEIREDCEERVDSPGKFELQERYVPYFYQFLGEGELIWAPDPRPESITRIEVSDRDREIFPELQDTEEIFLHESHDGFVEEWDREEVERKLEKIDRQRTFTGGGREENGTGDF